MKLKLHTQNTETLQTTLSIIGQLRKFVILQFSREQLLIILAEPLSATKEPQIWCKLNINSVFDQVEIQSLRDNVILLEANTDILLQTLRNFDKANSEGLYIRLQKKDGSKGQGSSSSGRLASLALFYSTMNMNDNQINHTFRVPVRVLRKGDDEVVLKEPALKRVDMMIRLPKEFASIYKRLEKFKKTSNSEMIEIQCSKERGGFLGFVLEEEGKYKVTISWNEKLDIRVPQNSESDEESLRFINSSTNGSRNDDGDSQTAQNEYNGIVVKLRDWNLTSKIVATCKNVILLLVNNEACVLHCLLRESNDVEIMYYINGTRNGEIRVS